MFFTTKAFWKDAADRAVSTAAEAALAAIGVDAMVSAFNLDYLHVAGVALGGALLALLRALARSGRAQARSGGDVE